MSIGKLFESALNEYDDRLEPVDADKDYHSLNKFREELKQQLEDGSIHGLFGQVEHNEVGKIQDQVPFDQIMKDSHDMKNIVWELEEYAGRVSAPANIEAMKELFKRLDGGPRWFVEALNKKGGSLRNWMHDEYPKWLSLSRPYARSDMELLDVYRSGKPLVRKLNKLVQYAVDQYSTNYPEAQEDINISRVAGEMKDLIKNCAKLADAYSSWLASMEDAMKKSAEFYGIDKRVAW